MYSKAIQFGFFFFFLDTIFHCCGFPGDSAVKASAWNVGDLGSIPGLGRSPGEGKGYQLQNPGMENFVDCLVHGGPKKSNITEQLSLSVHRAVTSTPGTILSAL